MKIITSFLIIAATLITYSACLHIMKSESKDVIDNSKVSALIIRNLGILLGAPTVSTDSTNCVGGYFSNTANSQAISSFTSQLKPFAAPSTTNTPNTANDAAFINALDTLFQFMGVNQKIAAPDPNGRYRFCAEVLILNKESITKNIEQLKTDVRSLFQDFNFNADKAASNNPLNYLALSNYRGTPIISSSAFTIINAASRAAAK